MRRIKVAVQPRPYEAVIENGVLKSAGERVAEVLGRKRVFVVTTPRVRRHWGRVLAKSLRTAKVEHAFLEMGEGERAKTLATVERLAEQMVKLGADRGAAVVGFGGGVVGDVAGMLASVYMRGVDVVQVPTTLLAQVDASIGGKTGVNLRSGKNLVGTFHQPRAVLIDPAALGTLADREYRSGLFEVLKCGVIANVEIFRFLEERREQVLRRDAAALEWLIAECVRVKADVVAADEREGGLRRILNFGHTVGHALEADTNYRHYLHGEAVGWGMIAASRIAAATGWLDEASAERVADLVRAYGPLPKVKSKPRNIVRLLTRDKKTRNGVVHFVLPREIGRVEIAADVPERVVAEAVGAIRN